MCSSLLLDAVQIIGTSAAKVSACWYKQDPTDAFPSMPLTRQTAVRDLQVRQPGRRQRGELYPSSAPRGEGDADVSIAVPLELQRQGGRPSYLTDELHLRARRRRPHHHDHEEGHQEVSPALSATRRQLVGARLPSGGNMIDRRVCSVTCSCRWQKRITTMNIGRRSPSRSLASRGSKMERERRGVSLTLFVTGPHGFQGTGRFTWKRIDSTKTSSRSSSKTPADHRSRARLREKTRRSSL